MLIASAPGNCIYLEQCFSTFFNSKEKFGSTLMQRKFFKKDIGKSLYYNQNAFFSPKRIVKVRKYKMAAHLEGARGTLVYCGVPVEEH
jgi:hypothetical protein